MVLLYIPHHQHLHISSVSGIVVSIAAFQAVDPGSIPGHRMLNLFDFNFDSRIVSFLKRKGEISKISFPVNTNCLGSAVGSASVS